MNASVILDAINDEIVARGFFIVDISVSKDNDIVIIIESEEGVVELDHCVGISRYFETKFDRETEDYSLTVSSAGLDQPFKVLKQYQKAVGTKVEVSLKGGKKKKELVEHEDRYLMDQINAVRPYLTF